jgi:hypothetical protein
LVARPKGTRATNAPTNRKFPLPFLLLLYVQETLGKHYPVIVRAVR